MHTAEVYDTYWERGWAVVPEVFAEDHVDAVSRLAMAVAIAELASGDGDEADVDQLVDGNAMPRKVMHPFEKEDAFARFALNPTLRRVLESIIGKPVALVSDQIFMKPPHVGSAKPYHQDNAYFRCHPGDEVITAWIALDDVDEENGCLRYIDGSHRLPILEHHAMPGERYNLQPAASDIDMSRESPAPVRKGGVVLHHGHTLHTSRANRSDRWRRAYATHWVSRDVVSDVETIDRAYFTANASRYAAMAEAD